MYGHPTQPCSSGRTGVGPDKNAYYGTMSSYTSPEHHPAFEEYCETIFELEEDGVRVIQARIVERLGVSRPAVSEMIKRMDAEGLVTFGNEIVLTDRGRSLASTMVRRHRLAERFLTDVLHLSWASAHHEAGKWEHVISPEVEDAIAGLLENPTTCPHGNPIPGSGFEATALRSLREVAVGADFVVARIPEELEFEAGMLEFLEASELMPGTEGSIIAISPDGTTTVDINGSAVGLGSFVVDRILVNA